MRLFTIFLEKLEFILWKLKIKKMIFLEDDEDFLEDDEDFLEIEEEYYNLDSNYTSSVKYEVDFEGDIISFEDRKKTTIPSKMGLYPAEILLLEYCSKGKYPLPKNDYPGFWWFEYGINNVQEILESLEDRGYINFTSAKDSVIGLTVAQLKKLLMENGQPTTGRKAELVMRVVKFIQEEDLIAAGVQLKYVLTEIGKQELIENAYVPYMHKVPNKTGNNCGSNCSFNVWIINKLLGTGDKSNWKNIVEKQEQKVNKRMLKQKDVSMKYLKKTDPDSYKVLKDQDDQLKSIHKARNKYDEDKDLDSYIAFWEMIWLNGGLKFEGVKWHFELPDLYIKAKRYDDALSFVTELKKNRPTYAYKAEKYIKRIEELKIKKMKYINF